MVDPVNNNPVDPGAETTETTETTETSSATRREAEVQAYTETADEINTVIAELGGGSDVYVTATDLQRKFGSIEEAKAFLETVKSAKSNPGDLLPSSVLYKTVTLDHEGLSNLNETKAAYDAAVSEHGGSSIDFDLFLARFDGDIGKFKQYLEKRDEIVASDPSITKEQIDEWAKQQMAMASTPSNGDELISILSDVSNNHVAFQESAAAHGGSTIDFNTFLTGFNGDIEQFNAYLAKRDEVIALDPSITKEQLDEWAKQKLADNPSNGANAVVDSLTNVITGHDLLVGTSGYSVMSALESAHSSSPYAAPINFANAATDMTKDRLETLKEIKQLSADLLTEYNNAKQNAGDGSDETEHMKELRLQLGQKLLEWEGVPPEQIPQDLAGVVAMCSEKGYSLDTNRNGNDDRHNKDEWGVNIIMIENINEQFKAESGELMSHIQQYAKLVEQILEISATVSKMHSDLATQAFS